MAYIVELWNQGGLFAGPGQVYADTPRQAAVTVMRNIGRTQLSAGGSPLVVHVQHLETGQEHHYGWPSALEGGAPVSKKAAKKRRQKIKREQNMPEDEWNAVLEEVKRLNPDTWENMSEKDLRAQVNAVVKERAKATTDPTAVHGQHLAAHASAVSHSAGFAHPAGFAPRPIADAATRIDALKRYMADNEGKLEVMSYTSGEPITLHLTLA